MESILEIQVAGRPSDESDADSSSSSVSSLDLRDLGPNFEDLPAPRTRATSVDSLPTSSLDGDDTKGESTDGREESTGDNMLRVASFLLGIPESYEGTNGFHAYAFANWAVGEAGGSDPEATDAKAIEYYGQALGIYLASLPVHHPVITTVRIQAADTYERAKEFSTAIDQRKLVLRSRTATLGERHPLTLEAHGTLGSSYYDNKNFDLAEAHHKTSIQGMQLNEQYDGEASEIDVKQLNPEARKKIAHAWFLLGCAQHAGGRLQDSLGSYGVALNLERFVVPHIEEDTKHHDLEVATIHTNIGFVHYSLKDYPSAIHSHEAALQLRESTLGPDSAPVGDSWNELGDVYMRQSKFALAVKAYERTLQVRIKTLAESDNDLAAAHHTLGQALLYAHQLNESLEHHKRGLALRQANADPDAGDADDDLDLATSHCMLGDTFLSKSDVIRALEHHEKSLAIRRARLGPADPLVIHTLERLGCSHKEAGNFKRAEECFEGVLQAREAQDEPDEEDLARVLAQSGYLAQIMGKKECCLERQRRALELRLKVLGKDDVSTAWSYLGVGDCLASMGNIRAALESQHKAVEILDRVCDGDSTDLACGHLNLGATLVRFGHYKEAMEHTQRASEVWTRAYGDDYPDLTYCFHNFGEQCSRLGDKETARAWFERTLAARTRILPNKDHPDIAYVRLDLGRLLRELGSLDGAREHLQEALRAFTQTFGESHHLVAQARGELGVVALQSGNASLAQELCEASVDQLRALQGPDHPDTARMQVHLGRILTLQGHGDDARTLFLAAVQTTQLRFDPHHPDRCDAERALADLPL